VRGAASFDFWLGTWACDIGGGRTATNTITRILGGRVIHERFVSEQLTGESHSVFDPKLGLWLQTWVDDQGGYLLFTGEREADAMVLVGRKPTGEPNGMRMRWHALSGERFEWDYEKVQPDGRWATQWHIDYRRTG
jgi:hypothetical protein